MPCVADHNRSEIIRRVDEARSVIRGLTAKSARLNQLELESLTVGLAWTRAHPEALQVGRVFIHPSEDRTGTLTRIRRTQGEVDFGSHKKALPLNELISSFAAKLASEKLQLFSSSNVALARIEHESDVLVRG